MSEVFALIVAGGNGTRMQSTMPKQFMTLAGKPIFVHSIQTFLEAIPDVQIILVLPEAHINTGEELLKQHQLYEKVNIVAGGETRFHSVKAGLTFIKKEGIIMVHDAVRCLASVAFIKKCYSECNQYGSAVPVIASKDSIRLRMGDEYTHINREQIFAVQTPQSFRSELLLRAFDAAYDPKFTDEATVVEQTGVHLHFTAGEEINIKITRPIDLIFAEYYLTHK